MVSNKTLITVRVAVALLQFYLTSAAIRSIIYDCSPCITFCSTSVTRSDSVLLFFSSFLSFLFPPSLGCYIFIPSLSHHCLFTVYSFYLMSFQSPEINISISHDTSILTADHFLSRLDPTSQHLPSDLSTHHDQPLIFNTQSTMTFNNQHSKVNNQIKLNSIFNSISITNSL